MAVIGISYEGGNYHDDFDNLVEEAIIYKHVYLYVKNKETTFNSGNFVKDWFDAKKMYLDIQDKEPYLSASSSCDDFVSDGAKFDSAYLHMEDDDTPVLKYLDKSIDSLKQQDIWDGWEFFVPEGTTPTWEELKKMCA